MTRGYDGLGAASGVALAPAWRPRRAPVDDGRPPAAVSAEQVADAFQAVAARIEGLAASYRRDGAAVSADVLDAEALIAADPTFVDDAMAGVGARGVSAPAAVLRVAERHAAVLERLESVQIRDRAADVRHIGRLVADRLAGRTPPPAPDTAFVLLADEVTAPELLEHADRVVPDP